MPPWSTLPQAPCDPGQGAFPRPVLTLASRRSPCPLARSCSAAPQTPRSEMVCFHGRSLVPRPHLSGDSWRGHGPRAPVPERGVPARVGGAPPTSPGGTLLASLVRAPAPVLLPPPGSVLPSPPGLGRWLAAPAGSRPFPTFSRRRGPGVLGPLPRRRVRRPGPLLPSRPRPAPRADPGGAPPWTVQRLPDGALVAAAVMRGCAGPPGCSPPRSLLPRRLPPSGRRACASRAAQGVFPPHAPAMLPVCIGQWTVWGLAPHEIRSLVGCSPNAAPQPLLEAAGERQLESVGCRRLRGLA